MPFRSTVRYRVDEDWRAEHPAMRISGGGALRHLERVLLLMPRHSDTAVICGACDSCTEAGRPPYHGLELSSRAPGLLEFGDFLPSSVGVEFTVGSRSS